MSVPGGASAARPGRSRRVLLAVVAVVSLGTAVTACGDDDDADDATEATTAATDAPEAPDETGDAGEGATIVISEFSFGAPLSVPVGTTVRVVNNDSSPHTWTSVDGVFDSGQLGIGEDFDFEFADAGTFSFQCMIHPTMTGEITVTE